MVKQPRLGVVYKVNLDRLMRVPLYQVTKRRVRNHRGGTQFMPQYAFYGWLEAGQTVVFIDAFKSSQGHNEIYAVTEKGDCGWIAMHVPDTRKAISFVAIDTE